MKTASAGFMNRLLAVGEKPNWLAKIYYDASSFFLVSTDQITIGSDIYEPYVLGFGSLGISMDIEDAISTPNQITISLIRNSTTQNLFDDEVKNKKVEIWAWFKGLSSFGTDALKLGTFIIDKVDNIELGQFDLTCSSDESKLGMEIPRDLLNRTDYPKMNEDFLETPEPIFLGNRLNPVDPTYRYLDTYKTNAVECFCVEKNLYRFVAYKKVPLCQSLGSRAYEYDSANKLLAELYSMIDDAANWSVYNSADARHVDINPYTESSSGRGNTRRLRLLPNRPHSSNNVSNWANACDKDRSTVANLTTVENILRFGFDESEKSGRVGNYIPSGWADTAYYRIKIATNIDAISGTVRLTLYHPLGSTAMGDFNSTGYKESVGTWSNPGGGILDLTKFSIKAELISGSSASLDGFHLIVGYYTRADVIESNKHPNRKAERRRGIKPSPIEVPEYKGGQIFVEGTGPSDQSGQGWDYRSPISQLYFLMVEMMGIPSGEIALTNWDGIDGLLAMPPGPWRFAYSLYRQESGIGLVDSLLRECFLKMFKDADNQWRLFRFNPAGATPDMNFTDNEESAYFIKDLRWGWMDEFYNKYDIKYKFDSAKNEYEEALHKDKDNDVDLLFSYNRYSQTEVEYPYKEAEWIREKDTIDLLFDELKRFWYSLPIIAEFKTGLVGSLLEPGDIISIIHQSYLSMLGSKFQIIEIEHNNNEVFIKAIHLRN